jgi:hypothetical protein
MLNFIRAAAFAAMLSLVPGATPGLGSAPPAASIGAPVSVSASAAPTPAAPTSDDAYGLPTNHEHDHDAALAPGQSPEDFRAWLGRNAGHRAELAAFRDRLAADGVEDVVPLWQLLRTGSEWRQCGSDPFAIAPRDTWDHIVRTLKFVRDQVEPAIGEVEPLSGYRDAALNACSGGAPRSAHRHFFALDLVPVDLSVTRESMIRSICIAHARDGRAYDAGLGFYTRFRFHVDSNGYRDWGADGRGATSPCATYA